MAKSAERTDPGLDADIVQNGALRGDGTVSIE